MKNKQENDVSPEIANILVKGQKNIDSRESVKRECVRVLGLQ